MFNIFEFRFSASIPGDRLDRARVPGGDDKFGQVADPAGECLPDPRLSLSPLFP
jgi:hypothetical protein